jgi:hypothetical protein
MNRIESVWIGKDSGLLDAMFDFYAPTALRIIDVCCNARRMWKGATWGAKVVGYDRDPAVMPDVVCSWEAMPDAPGSVDVLVYDPPHMPTAGGTPASIGSKRGWGLQHSVNADNISSLHAPFLAEAKRVLKDDGLVFAKVKDYIHNHRYQWNLEMLNAEVRASGLVPCDLIIKRDPCGGNLKSGRWQKAHHAKNTHCFWLVIRKSSRCEPKASLRST